MPETLLRTKLFVPPLRPNLVPRPQLIDLLFQGLQLGHMLTLVSAPAGFGKTTLVSEWVTSLRLDSSKDSHVAYEIAWLSLDEGDNDPARFLAYLVAALNQLEGLEIDIGAGALSMLQSPQPPPPETILTLLINEIVTISHRIILVLDDFHLIETQIIHDALTYLLEHLPPQIHLVIATREDPHLPLARLRSRGQLTEVRARELRFTSAEAAEFLNRVMGLSLAEEDIAALESRTEGWIAGLQLAAISMKGHKDAAGFIKSFTGSHRFVLDYLIEEVLEHQSESVQAFLLKTAILDRLTGSLCDALTGREDGRATLETLEHANLFIVRLDEERRWYRYHHLFSDLLRRRLRQTRPDEVLTLHHRAGEWYQQNGFADEAIEHALHAQDFEWAAQLIEERVETLWGRGESGKLRRWLEKLPDRLLFSKPQLCIFHAWSLYSSGQPEEADRTLQAAERALGIYPYLAAGARSKGRDQSLNSDRRKLQGRIAVTRAFLAFFRGDLPEIIHYSRQALECLPEQDSAWRSGAALALGDAYRIQGEMKSAHRARLEALEISKAAGHTYMILTASMKLVVTMRQQGWLERVIEVCQQQLQLANESGLSQAGVSGGFLAIWGEVLAELDDLDEAYQRATRGVELAEGGEDMVVLGWSYLCLMRVLFSRGDWVSAEALVKKIENNSRDSGIPPWITKMMAAWQARMRLAQEKPEAASHWMAERGLDVDKDLQFLREMEHMVMARILMAHGRLDEAALLLPRLLQAAEIGGRISSEIELLILQALVLGTQGDVDQAVSTVEKALVRAEPGGFVRFFVDEGPPLAHLLYEALNRGTTPDYVRRLLAAFPDAESAPTAPITTLGPEPEWIEPLSERELEVLQLVADGLTNPEIASRLFLSLNTVKVHTRNIYGKLDTHNRTQAVSRARALGILPST